MDDLGRKFRSIDWKGLQKSARKVQASTASALKDMVMTDLENKTRAATADTAWGASGTDLMFIAQGTYQREDYALIMSIVWQRLASRRWRCVYKSLELLKHLIMHGTARVAEESRAALPHLRALTDYVASDEAGRDVGDGVRRRAALVCEMLSDDSVLEAERARSRELRAKLQGGTAGPGRAGGLSSDDYRYGSAGRNSGANYDSDGVKTFGTGGLDGGTGLRTATFKGYGEDDDDGSGDAGYDDVPNSFAARASAAAAAEKGTVGEKQSVDDLLGGPDLVGENGSEHNKATIEDEDEDFDPRAASSAGGAPATATGLDDIFSGIDTPTSQPSASAAANPAPSSSSAVPMSQLVQQLAAEREQMGMQVAVVPNKTTPNQVTVTSKASDADDPFSDLASFR